MHRPPFASALLLAVGAPLSAQSIGFTEVAQESGIVAEYTVFDTEFRQIEFMMAGGAVADFDGDGWEDVFVLTGDKDDDRLYINNRDGTFTDRAQEWGVAKKHVGSGASVGDFNSDGLPDIYVTSLGPSNVDKRLGAHMLYRNNGDGTFTDVAEQAGVDSLGAIVPDGFSAAWGDYDLDGDLDLAVALWSIPNPHGVALFRNNGNATFTRVDELIGMDTSNTFGFTPAFADMDQDGWPELLVASDFTTSAYFVNNRDGTFTRRTRQDAGLVDTNGMGQVVADLTGDGVLDWYVSNICCAGPVEFWEGQNLFENIGDHTFSDIARASGVEDAEWAWGADACDLDNDGNTDLVTVTGWFFPGAMPNKIFHCNPDGTFNDVSDACGFNDRDLARGVSSFDYDRDGDIDLVVFNHEGPTRLYRNDLTGFDTNYLRVRLDTRNRPDLAPNGIGAWIELDTARDTDVRYVDGAPTYLATSSLDEHFGLGGEGIVAQLRVRWPDGSRTTLSGLSVNRTLTIFPPPTCAFSDQDDDGAPDFGDFDPTADGATDIEDLYAAQSATHDVNHDGLADAGDARCMHAFLRAHEIDPR
ncbi:MAG: CRTAC1 family protein [Planctomycetota bacterium]